MRFSRRKRRTDLIGTFSARPPSAPTPEQPRIPRCVDRLVIPVFPQDRPIIYFTCQLDASANVTIFNVASTDWVSSGMKKAMTSDSLDLPASIMSSHWD